MAGQPGRNNGVSCLVKPLGEPRQSSGPSGPSVKQEDGLWTSSQLDASAELANGR